MPARDYYHDIVKKALQKDGWTITHDPYRIRLARRKNLFVDLGAERLIAAEKDLEEAVGQFVLYEHLLTRYEPERKLYLAVPEDVRQSIFEEEAGQVLIEDKIIRLFSFNVNQAEVVVWIT